MRGLETVSPLILWLWEWTAEFNRPSINWEFIQNSPYLTFLDTNTKCLEDQLCWNKCSQSLPEAVWLLATLHGLTKDFYLNPFLRAVVKKKTVFFVLKLRDCTVYFHKVYNKPILVQVCVDLYASNLKQLLSHPSYAVESYLLVVEYCSNCSVFDIFGFFCNLINTNWSQSNNFEQLGFLLP